MDCTSGSEPHALADVDVSARADYGIILLQPDIIGAEHSGERCPQYGLAVVVTPDYTSPWLVSARTHNESMLGGGGGGGVTEIEAAKSRYCAQQLTSDDYAATFVAASGELPGILLMVSIIDRIGRRATMGWGVAISAAVFVLLIPCTSYLTETALIWLGRGVANAFFQSMFV